MFLAQSSPGRPRYHPSSSKKRTLKNNGSLRTCAKGDFVHVPCFFRFSNLHFGLEISCNHGANGGDALLLRVHGKGVLHDLLV